MKSLDQSCSAIVFDLPNHGVGLSVEAFAFDDVADDIVAVLDRLGLPEVIVCGYSLGGICAMTFADRHPARTSGIVVQASAMRYGANVRDRAFLCLCMPCTGSVSRRRRGRSRSATSARAEAEPLRSGRDGIGSTSRCRPIVSTARARCGRPLGGPAIVTVECPVRAW
ncbi:alpha/beta fold hydrolase [Rhodococcus sp. IEGM1428]|uniref:alpha/beta fold hydrolase n=1 Tax=Rhodococcus sp. IEGM1428 TaxID=3392191 RepID=UPI003D0CD332